MYQKLHILGKVLASVHWNLLHCNLHCDSILYLTSLLSSPAGQTVYECATKGQTLQTGRSKHSWQKQSPRNGKKIPRGAGEAPGQQSVVGSLRHQQQSFPCTLLCFCVQSRRSAVVCSRPFNEEHLLAESGCASIAARSSSCCKGNRPAAAAFWFKRVNAL